MEGGDIGPIVSIRPYRTSTYETREVEGTVTKEIPEL